MLSIINTTMIQNITNDTAVKRSVNPNITSKVQLYRELREITETFTGQRMTQDLSKKDYIKKAVVEFGNSVNISITEQDIIFSHSYDEIINYSISPEIIKRFKRLPTWVKADQQRLNTAIELTIKFINNLGHKIVRWNPSLYKRNTEIKICSICDYTFTTYYDNQDVIFELSIADNTGIVLYNMYPFIVECDNFPNLSKIDIDLLCKRIRFMK